MELEPQCKTVADLHREWARVVDMANAANINPLACWKFLGVKMNISFPTFNEPPSCYEFAIAIVEGKPVFRGDVLYIEGHLKSAIIGKTKSILTGEDLLVCDANYGGYSISRLSWNPPKPKEEVTDKTTITETVKRQYHVGDYLHCKVDTSFLKMEGNGLIVSRVQTISHEGYANTYTFCFDNGVIVYADDSMLSPIEGHKVALTNLPIPTNSWHTERCANEFSIHFKFKTPEESTAMEKIVLGQLSKQM